MEETLRLLVVEDSADDYQILLHFLGRAGYRVQPRRVDRAEDLAQALREGPWDLVISDHDLPGFSSREALAQVSADPADLPFIIVSGKIGEDAAVDAMLAGADDYVVKGKLNRLPPAIERSVAAASERRRLAASEAAKRESDARLSGIADNLPGVVLQIGFDTATGSIRLPYLSEGAPGIFGIGTAEMIADPSLLPASLHEDDRAAFMRCLADAAFAGAPLSWEGCLEASGRQEPRWILVSASPRPAQGDLCLWDGLVMDLTRQKKAEREVRRSRERLRELSAHFEAVKETERAEIARELHDELGGLLTGLKADIDWLRRNTAAIPGAGAKVNDMEKLTADMVAVARRVARALRPAILDQGLVPALEWLARDFRERTGISCEFEANAEELSLPPATATQLFRTVQESLTNVARHSGAKRAHVQLFASEREVSVEVRDDGRGVTASDRVRPGSFGLRGMEERIGHLGGWLDMSGQPGHGTTVMICVPRRNGSAP